MALSRNTQRTIGGGGAALIALLCGWLFVTRNYVNSNVVLKAGANTADACPVDNKANEVRVKRNGKLTWKIDDGSCSRREAVMVGNFRTVPSSSAANCDNPTEGSGVEWPFQEDVNDPDARRRQGNKIELRIRPDVTIPGTEPSVDYYYDVCTGTQNLKSDPRLVIER